MFLTKAEQKDTPTIIKILNDALRYKIELGDKSWGDEPWREDEIKTRIDEGYNFYLAHVDDKIVGTVALTYEDIRNWEEKEKNAVYIHHLAVASDYHNKNLGAQIIDCAADEARKQDKKYLRLDCDSLNSGLCEYYEILGFIKVGNNERPDKEMGNYKASLYEREV